MMMGLENLYTSSDGLENLTSLPAQGNGHTDFSAIVYGGRKAGQPYAEVFYAAAGEDVYIGSAYPALPAPQVQTYSTETIAGVSSITAIVLDPRDYDIAYVTTNKGVYKRVAANTWQLISQKLLNANLSAIEFVPKESLTFATGETPKDVLLVGGAAGVFRAFDPQPDVQWIQFGRNLPNVLVDSIDYVVTDTSKYENRRSLPSDPLLRDRDAGPRRLDASNANVALAQAPALHITGTASRRPDRGRAERGEPGHARRLDRRCDGVLERDPQHRGDRHRRRAPATTRSRSTVATARSCSPAGSRSPAGPTRTPSRSPARTSTT